MKKNILVFMFAFVLVILSACNGNKAEELELPEMLEVQLEVPDAVNAHDKIVMKAIVTQGEEKVADANEVEFEIWEDGKKEESTSIEAVNNDDGTYEAETTFEHDGVYTVQVHVTARGLHNMPKKDVTVGKGKSNEEEHHESDHGEHADGFGMHFMEPKDVKIEKAAEFTVHLQKDDTPLEKARVRFEIWNDEISEKHEWIDAEEVNPGEYTTEHTFLKPGSYAVQIHVTNDDGLHEHEEHEIEVKN